MQRTNALRPRAGFTLVELLVVIAIIGILVALLLPAVQAAREAARRMSCSNNCKQIGLALHNYHDTYKALPMAWFVDVVSAAPRMNAKPWGVAILPFIEQQPMYDQYDHNLAPFDQISPANVAVVQNPVSVFICPSAPGGAERKYTFDATLVFGFPLTATGLAPSDYLVSSKVRGAFASLAYPAGAPTNTDGVLQAHLRGIPSTTVTNLTTRLRDIVDGTSNTIVIGERTGGNTIYNKRLPEPALNPLLPTNGGGWGDILNGQNRVRGSLFSGAVFPSPGGPCAINCTNLRDRGFHSFHPGGCQFVMADGSVQFISETSSALGIAARITRQGGETVSN